MASPRQENAYDLISHWCLREMTVPKWKKATIESYLPPLHRHHVPTALLKYQLE